MINNVQPNANNQSDTIVAVISTDDLDSDYKMFKEAGVVFLNEPQ